MCYKSGWFHLHPNDHPSLCFICSRLVQFCGHDWILGHFDINIWLSFPHHRKTALDSMAPGGVNLHWTLGRFLLHCVLHRCFKVWRGCGLGSCIFLWVCGHDSVWIRGLHEIPKVASRRYCARRANHHYQHHDISHHPAQLPYVLGKSTFYMPYNGMKYGSPLARISITVDIVIVLILILLMTFC